MPELKKLTAILLTVCLVWGISMRAGAAEHMGHTGSKEIEVTAKYVSSTATPIVYSVDIDWSSMIFTYTQRNTNKWNAADHSYGAVSDGAWDNNTATITVTNHSNVAVDVKMKYTALGNTGVKGVLTNGSASLAAGETGNYDGADSFAAKLTISGTPGSAVTPEGVKVGTIKVTIR